MYSSSSFIEVKIGTQFRNLWYSVTTHTHTGDDDNCEASGDSTEDDAPNTPPAHAQAAQLVSLRNMKNIFDQV